MGPAGANRLKELVADLLTAGRTELQHQGGAVGAKDRDELATVRRLTGPREKKAGR